MKLFVLAMPLLAIAAILTGTIYPYNSSTEPATEPAPGFVAYYNSAEIRAKRQQFNASQGISLSSFKQCESASDAKFLF